MVLKLAAGEAHRLRPIVRSHGWSDLPPFDTDLTGDVLKVSFLLPGCGPVCAELRDSGAISARILSTRPSSTRPFPEAAAVAVLRSCLQLDLDLEPFWALCREDPVLAWAAEMRAGRFLRAPTAFADAAIVLATTNCSWGLTRHIVAALVREWGEGGAFPTQAAIARASVSDLRERGRLGYRAAYLSTLARGFDLEGLRMDTSPTPVLRARLLDLPGFGPYAAESMMRLLGRFEHLALDSWVERRYRELYPRRVVSPAAINRQFARYGAWRGLALWLLMTEPWYRREAWRDKFAEGG